MAVWKATKLRGISSRIFILLLSMLLIIQLLVSLTATRTFSSGRGDEPAFIVISIEKSDGSRSSEVSGRKNQRDGRLGLWNRGDLGPPGYEDENEVDQRQITNRKVKLQPRASGKASFIAEMRRLTQFITTTEVNCSVVWVADALHSSHSSGQSDVLCITHWKDTKGCVAYSFSLDEKDATFLGTMCHAGCDVHRFDPSGRGNLGDLVHASIKTHRAWLDWKRNSKSGIMGNVHHRLADIMDFLGHSKVDVLRMDLESAEWRVLESWIEDGTLKRINQLILTIHLQWAGFEVGGADDEVVRFWYSVLKALRISGLCLVHSAHGPGHTVLKHNLPTSYSTYTLSWIRKKDRKS